MNASLSILVLAAATAAGAANGSRYGFYRDMRGAAGGGGGGGGAARRVFGGTLAPLSAYGAACALLDRYWAPRCSGAVLAPRWVLTAAHCASPHVAYVKYNTRRPASAEGDAAPVHYLYRHPDYKVVQEDEGRGPDVTVLRHDVGLVRTRRDMRLISPPEVEPLRAMRLYDPLRLGDEEAQVLGFGRTERSTLGEELFEVRLRLVECGRGGWSHCVCGVSRAARGVCSGDSGGPALVRGAPVGVTSMGPLDCAAPAAEPPESATSVFTALRPYARMLNDTIYDTEAALRMQRIAGVGAGARAAPRAPLALALSLALALAPALALAAAAAP